MKIWMVTICVLLSSVGLRAQGIVFFEGSWEAALQEAARQDKIIFVDAFAEWCGPCKRMAKTVFTDPGVGEFYNKNFINLKLDMEKGEGLTFRGKYPVSAFPTLFYIDNNGEVVQKIMGAQTVENFIALGKQALGKIDRSQRYAEEYEKGNRDPELVYQYVKALNRAGKPSLKIANEYLDSQQELTTDQNLRFILEATLEADSRIFDLLTENRKSIAAVESEEAVQNKIQDACNATVQKAISFESQMLLEEAKEKMKRHYPEKATAFSLRADMDYFQATGDAAQYVKACKAYAQKEAKKNPEALYQLALDLMQHFGRDAGALEQAEAFSREAAEKGDSYAYFLTYAAILDRNGKKPEAVRAAKTSLEMARSHGQDAVKQVEMFLQKLEG